MRKAGNKWGNGFDFRPLPGGVKTSPPSIKPEIELKLPSEADIDRLMTFMEKIWRRLIDMVQNLQKDIDKKG